MNKYGFVDVINGQHVLLCPSCEVDFRKVVSYCDSNAKAWIEAQPDCVAWQVSAYDEDRIILERNGTKSPILPRAWIDHNIDTCEMYESAIRTVVSDAQLIGNLI